MHQRGFSLLELSVILLIIGTMAGGLMVIANKKVEQNKYDITIDRLKLIDKTLTAYSQRGHILPCPASATADVDSANFGVSDNCAGSAPALAGVSVAVDSTGASTAGTADEVWIGAVPTRALSLPDSVMFDGWGDRIRYVVVKSLASSVAEFENFQTTTSGMTAGILIQDGYAHNLTDISKLNVAAYTLISFGKDKVGARPRIAATVPVACPSASTVKSEENCDDDNIFIDTAYNDGNVAATYYDDIMRWRSWYRLAPVEKPELPELIPNLMGVGQAGGCAVNTSAQLVCWGTNQFGTLGLNNKNYAYSIPQATGTAGTGTNFTDWEKVSVNGRSVCGLRNGGELWCWGRNGLNQLGNGVGSGYPCEDSSSSCTEHVVIPTRIGAYSDWVFAVAGGCGIRSNGRAYCWGVCPGDNATPCNGDDSLDNNIINTYVHASKGPVEIKTDATYTASPNTAFTDWVKIRKSAHGGCGLRANGELWCWGLNLAGTVGDGSATLVDPNDAMATGMKRGVVPTVGGCQGNYKDVAGGDGVMCGICRTGEAYCWGSNTSGQLGANIAPYCPTTGTCQVGAIAQVIGSPDPRESIPPYYEGVQFNTTTSSASNPITATAANTYTIGAAYFRTTPVLVSGGYRWSTMVSATGSIGQTVCGVTVDGHAYCWGDNYNESRGTSGPDAKVPTEVYGGYSDWIDYGMGQKFVCGTRSDKKMYCWGDRWYCDLGQGEPGANPATSLAQTLSICADKVNPSPVYGLTLPF